MSILKDFKELKKDLTGAIGEEEGKSMESGLEMGNEKDREISGMPKQQQTAEPAKDVTTSASGDVTVIASGSVIEGDMESSGSISVYGRVEGKVNCAKKFVAGGFVNGDIHAGEVFINKAEINGNIVSEGGIKIGKGSVITGDLKGYSAVIAGAVQGEIDIKGPVIIDNTAVIQGNIKSSSVQINNGAVIEGFCTQCYHEVDVKEIFKEVFSEEKSSETLAETIDNQEQN